MAGAYTSYIGPDWGTLWIISVAELTLKDLFTIYSPIHSGTQREPRFTRNPYKHMHSFLPVRQRL